jgi:hypothetical protein
MMCGASFIIILFLFFSLSRLFGYLSRPHSRLLSILAGGGLSPSLV